MYCRPSYSTDNSSCSIPFLFVHSNLNHHTCSPLPSHDQKLPPKPAPRHRRRLEDPVLTYASNYYATYPRQTSRSPAQLLSSPPRITPRQMYQQLESNSTYCDLFNLLERPPPVKQRRKYASNDLNSLSQHHSVDYKTLPTKVKDANAPKHHHKANKSQEDKIPSTKHYDQLQVKTTPNTCIYRQYPANKGFFRRVASNYFCIPVTVDNGKLSK